MEKKIRLRFIVTTTVIMFVVLGAIMVVLNVSNYSSLVSRADESIRFSEIIKLGPNDKNKMRDQPIIIDYDVEDLGQYFDNGVIKVDKLGYNIEFDNNSFSDLTLVSVQNLLNSNKTSGFFSTFRYYNNESTKILYILPFAKDIQYFVNTLTNSIIVFFVSLTSAIVLVFIFSKRAIQPMVESYDKQKKFITDASHELKTPIAVINSSVELLEMDFEDNKWLAKIKESSQKLNILVNDLLALARMDENAIAAEFEDIDLSGFVRELCDYYEPIFINKKCKLKIEVVDNLKYYGDRNKIIKMFQILLDNASKYALDGSEVSFKIYKKGKKLIIKSKNEAEGLVKGDCNQIFERFTRLDSSRNSSTGGYGIGLAMLDSIVQLHKGRASATSDGKYLEIKIEI